MNVSMSSLPRLDRRADPRPVPGKGKRRRRRTRGQGGTGISAGSADRRGSAGSCGFQAEARPRPSAARRCQPRMTGSGIQPGSIADDGEMNRQGTHETWMPAGHRGRARAVQAGFKGWPKPTRRPAGAVPESRNRTTRASPSGTPTGRWKIDGSLKSGTIYLFLGSGPELGPVIPLRLVRAVEIDDHLGPGLQNDVRPGLPDQRLRDPGRDNDPDPATDRPRVKGAVPESRNRCHLPTWGTARGPWRGRCGSSFRGGST